MSGEPMDRTRGRTRSAFAAGLFVGAVLARYVSEVGVLTGAGALGHFTRMRTPWSCPAFSPAPVSLTRNPRLLKPGVLKPVMFEVVTTVVSHRLRYDAGNRANRTEGMWFDEVLGLPNTRLHVNLVDANEATLTRLNGKVGLQAVSVPNPGRAQECPGYLRYMAQRYDTLPDVSIFLHGYPFDHNPDIIKEIGTFIRLASKTGTLPPMDFVHLNTDAYPERCLRVSKLHQLQKIFLSPADPGCLAMVYCCAQFMVTRETIRRIHRRIYQRALNVTSSSQDCSNMEHSWHALFRGQNRFNGLTVGELLQDWLSQVGV
jgi:hypothetical protein